MKSTNLTAEIPPEIKAIAGLIDEAKYTEALSAMTHYAEEHPNDMVAVFYKSSILVDVGFRLRDQGIVQQGIEAGESILNSPTCDKYRDSTLYNLSNAYIDLFFLLEWRNGSQAVPQSDNLQKTKTYLRNVILSSDGLSRDFNRQLWVNYGNCLDTLGRGIEAFHAYDEALKFDPNFSMAIGNKAKASMYFANISGNYHKSIYVQAYQAIKAIINDPDLIKTGGPDAKQRFERNLHDIEIRFKDEPDILIKPIVHPPYDMAGLSHFEKFYINYCRREKLFLNFHIHDDQCEVALCDPIFIRVRIDPSHDDPFAIPYKFANYINQIKEDFMVARLLLVQSQYRRSDFDSISQMTALVYSLDYSKFNLYIGLLKSAFKEAFNILDKVSVFINDYYDLGLDSEQISFISKQDNRCVWQCGDNIREKILASKNMSLFAIYDIFLDFKSGYHNNIRNIRNSLTHRKLVVYDSAIALRDIEDEKHEITYNALLETTTELMRLVKAVIIYLINFVNTEERKKLKDDDGGFSIPFDTTQYF